MDVDSEQEVLKLPVEDRARLARRLLDGLDELSREELERLWLDEAGRRAAQRGADVVEWVSSEELERKVQALLRK
jgi:hypothetical protein